MVFPENVVEPSTHWGRVTHMFAGNLTIIGSDNGLSPGRRQAIIWSNVGKLLIRPFKHFHSGEYTWNNLRVKTSICVEIALENVVCEMAPILFWPQCVL